MQIWMRCVAVACFACALALTGAGVMAAESRESLGPALEAGQAFSGKVMKGALLRRCVTLDDEINQLHNRLQALQSTMDVYSRAIDRAGAALDAEHATLDLTDADAVANYNRKVEAHDAVIAKHDFLLPEHNELVARQSPRVEEFNAKCAGIAYFIKEWINTDVVPDPALMPPATEF